MGRKYNVLGTKIKLTGDLLITDPCYITKDACWPRGDFSNGGKKEGVYLVTPTGVGDISGGVFAAGEEVGGFCVDAGVFGVFSLAELEKEAWFDKEKYNEHVEKYTHCLTILKDFDGEIEVALDQKGTDDWGDTYKLVAVGNFDWEARQSGW
jgi:hypothetical protein